MRLVRVVVPLVPQVRDLLKEYEVAGKGKVRVEIIDPASNPAMEEEVFGPACLIVECENKGELEEIAAAFSGHLTGTVWSGPGELENYTEMLDTFKEKVGRLIFNGYPTGVEVCTSMNHGGPFPSTSQPRFTSVGTDAIQRFVRPVCYQNCPDDQLPPAIQESNPLKIWRMVDGEWSK